jgi:surface protein
MFYRATSFNQPLADWDVSSVTRLEYIFAWVISFNQPIGAWGVSSVTNVRKNTHTLDYYMFHHATAFRQNMCPWARKLPEALSVMEMFSYTSCPNPHGPNPYGTCAAVLENFCFDYQPDNTTAEVQEAACLSRLPNDLDGWTMVAHMSGVDGKAFLGDTNLESTNKSCLRQPTFSAGLTILPISGMRFSLSPATDPSGPRQTTRISRAVGIMWGLPIRNLRHASVVQNPG